jgi:hypothetical protein
MDDDEAQTRAYLRGEARRWRCGWGDYGRRNGFRRMPMLHRHLNRNRRYHWWWSFR